MGLTYFEPRMTRTNTPREAAEELDRRERTGSTSRAVPAHLVDAMLDEGSAYYTKVGDILAPRLTELGRAKYTKAKARLT